MAELLPVPVRVRYRLAPWWARVILIFALSRVVTTVLILLLAAGQGPNPWTGASPGYFDYATIWDGNWFQIVSSLQYPSSLPLTDTGHVAQNGWAFLPGYPLVVRAVMFITLLPWKVASVLVSVGFALAGALVFYRLLRARLDEPTTIFAVVLFCVAPLSPILQLSYSESMFQFLLLTALWLMTRHRYWALLPLIAAMGFTRPSELAFALALALHTGWRWARRRRRAFVVRQRIAAVLATVFAGVMGLVWPAIAALVTGVPGAYFDTELAWRAGYIGYRPLVPFTPWVEAARWWFTTQLLTSAWLGYLALATLVVAAALALFSPAAKRLGADLRFWLASYALYLLAVFFPQSSTFRMLMPLAPALGAFAVPRSRLYRMLLVAACIAGQWVWLSLFWAYDGYDWTPP